MPISRVYNLGGLNTYVNPILSNDGDPIRSVNVDSYPYGAKTKRPGYATFLGTADGSAVTDLFSWSKNDGTTLFLYRVSGGKIYYSSQGTGVWTVAGNGTVSGEHVGHAILDDTLIVGDGVGSTRHTSNGTAFTNTTLAPVGEHFEQYQNRIYIGGTSSTVFYSAVGDASNWSTGGTADSSSFTAPGAGKINKVFVVADRLNISKNSGKMLRWDGYSLVDLATDNSPTSPYSVDSYEGYYFWLNYDGINGYGGSRPETLSNPVQAEIYNDAGNGIAGGVFGTAPGVVSRDSYLISVGTVTDDVVNETVNDCVIKYDFKKNQFGNYKYNDFPTCYLSYVDANGDEKLIFGTGSGQVMQVDGTKTSDNGNPIPVVLEFCISLQAPEVEKEWKRLWGIFNPGNQATMQVAVSDTYKRQQLRWETVSDFSDGIALHRFQKGQRGRLCFVRIVENSKTSKFKFYGFSVDADAVPYDK